MVSETELNDTYLLIAQDDNAPKTIIDALTNRTHIPYFHTKSDLRMPPSEWKHLLHPCEKLSGKNNYYYSYIKNPKTLPIHKEKILPFQEYLDKQYRPYLSNIIKQ